MSTYLQLCQRVAQESGTIPGLNQPATTNGLTGRLAQIAGWVQRAHEEVQRGQTAWKFLHAEFSGQTISGVREYDASALGISSRFSRWVLRDPVGQDLFTVFRTADGNSAEGFLRRVEWIDFRRYYDIGSEAGRTGKPEIVTIDLRDRLRVWPVPDGEYTIRGMFYKSPQQLGADGDTPEMPAEFHDVILWRALMFLGTFDESFEQYPMWRQNYMRLFEQLQTHQMPSLLLPPALA